MVQSLHNLHCLALDISNRPVGNIRDSEFTQKHYTSWTIGNSYRHKLLLKWYRLSSLPCSTPVCRRAAILESSCELIRWLRWILTISRITPLNPYIVHNPVKVAEEPVVEMHIKSNLLIARYYFSNYTQRVLHSLPVRAKYEKYCESAWYGI